VGKRTMTGGSANRPIWRDWGAGGGVLSDLGHLRARMSRWRCRLRRFGRRGDELAHVLAAHYGPGHRPLERYRRRSSSPSQASRRGALPSCRRHHRALESPPARLLPTLCARPRACQNRAPCSAWPRASASALPIKARLKLRQAHDFSARLRSPGSPGPGAGIKTRETPPASRPGRSMSMHGEI